MWCAATCIVQRHLSTEQFLREELLIMRHLGLFKLSFFVFLSSVILLHRELGLLYVFRCMNGTAPRYLGSELQWDADIASHRRLRSASSPSLHVPRSLHRTIGNRAFPIAAAKIWNALPPAITSLLSLGAFKRALKTELFRRSYGNANYRPQQL